MGAHRLHWPTPHKVLYESDVQKLLDEVGLSLLDAANKSEWHNITRPEALAAQARAASGFSAQVAAKRPSAVKYVRPMHPKAISSPGLQTQRLSPTGPFGTEVSANAADVPP